jgi:hypothetical protein
MLWFVGIACLTIGVWVGWRLALGQVFPVVKTERHPEGELRVHIAQPYGGATRRWVDLSGRTPEEQGR